MQAKAAYVSKGRSHGEPNRDVLSQRRCNLCFVKSLCGGEATNNSLRF